MMLPQESLASSLTWSILFRPSYMFLCFWVPQEESEIFQAEKMFFQFPCSPLRENQTDGGKEFTIVKGTV